MLKLLAVPPFAKGDRLTLRGGLHSLIDPGDLKWAQQYHWFVKLSNNIGYVVRKVRRNGSESLIRLHREITQCPDHLEVHHVNHNSLDNRRCNLWICSKETHAQLRFKD